MKNTKRSLLFVLILYSCIGLSQNINIYKAPPKQIFRNYVLAYSRNNFVCPKPTSTLDIIKKLHRGYLYYQNLANHNDTDAQFYLGIANFYAIGTRADTSSAKIWLEKTIKYNNESLYQLGLINDAQAHAEITPKRSKQLFKNAFYWFKVGSERNHIESMRLLSLYYYFGIGTKTNHTKAYELIKRIKRKNLLLSQLAQADIDYMQKNTASQKQAVQLYSILANNSNKLSDFDKLHIYEKLALAYYTGHGAKKDMSKSKIWSDKIKMLKKC